MFECEEIKNCYFAGGLIGIEKDEANNDALSPIFGHAVIEEIKQEK